MKNAKQLLRCTDAGSIIVDSKILDEVTNSKLTLIEEITSRLVDNPLPDGGIVYQVRKKDLSIVTS